VGLRACGFELSRVSAWSGRVGDVGCGGFGGGGGGHRLLAVVIVVIVAVVDGDVGIGGCGGGGFGGGVRVMPSRLRSPLLVAFACLPHSLTHFPKPTPTPTPPPT
jgi:hypothetical protein